MDDVAMRLALVAGFLLLSLLGIAFMRHRAAAPFRVIRRTGLGPGVYFFSSATCAECRPARSVLVERLGEDGFVEHSWESDPGILESLGVDGVPATLVVEGSGSGRLWTGMPTPDVFAG
jgi:hypothetical protein